METKNPDSVSVIMPAYNEEKTIGDVIAKIPKGFEVIVVDDCSSDATAWIARNSGAKVLRNESRSGPEAGRNRGIAAASGDVIVTMDADGEHDPADITKLVSTLARGYDMVLGERYELPRLNERMMAWLVARRVKGIRDATTGFRAAWKSRMTRINSKPTCGASMILKMRKAGMNIGAVPIKPMPRRRSTRLRPLKAASDLMRTVFEVVFF